MNSALIAKRPATTSYVEDTSERSDGFTCDFLPLVEFGGLGEREADIGAFDRRSFQNRR